MTIGGHDAGAGEFTGLQRLAGLFGWQQAHRAVDLGRVGIRLTGKKGQVVAAFMVGLDDEIVAVSSGGVTIRMPVRDISSQGRDATGVRVMSLDNGQTVASVAPILSNEDED